MLELVKCQYGTIDIFLFLLYGILIKVKLNFDLKLCFFGREIMVEVTVSNAEKVFSKSESISRQLQRLWGQSLNNKKTQELLKAFEEIEVQISKSFKSVDGPQSFK